MYTGQRIYKKTAGNSSDRGEQTGLFRSRPFFDTTNGAFIPPAQTETPNLQTQIETAKRFGYNFSQVAVQGEQIQLTSQAKIQRSPDTQSQNTTITHRIGGDKAPLRDANNNFAEINPKTEYIPSLTSVILLENQTVEIANGKKKFGKKQEFSKVKWGGREVWIATEKLEKFDPTYATSLGNPETQALAEGVKQKKPSYQKDEATKENVSSVKELRSLNSLLGQVKTNTNKLSDPKEANGKEILPQGTMVIMVEEQVNEGKSYTKVSDFEGNECWVLSKHIKAIGDPRVFEELPGGGRGLFKENRLDNIKNEKAKEALKTAYVKKVQEFLKGKKLSNNQTQLLQRAMEFLGNSNLQGKLPELKLSEQVIQDGETPLNPDLIRRMNLFYKFLVHEKLADGYSPSISGARSSIDAHINSTKWTFSSQSQVLDSMQNKIKMARQLVETDGRDPSGKITWADSSQVRKLKDSLDLYDGKKPTSQQQENIGSQKTPQAQAQEEINSVISSLKSIYGTKTAVCAEGYPKGDSKRKPNINEKTGVSLHCGGEAIDITFRYNFNYYDPIVDSLATIFGLFRPVKEANTPEFWHYERVGVPIGERVDGGEQQYEEMKQTAGEKSSGEQQKNEDLNEHQDVTSLQGMIEAIASMIGF